MFDRTAFLQAPGGFEKELGREPLQRGADVLSEGVRGIEGELVAAAEAERLEGRVGVVEHLLAQDLHDLLPRRPVARQAHEFACALEPLHPEVVLPERGPDGPDVELHLLFFVAPAVLDLVDAVSRAPGQGAGAQIAAAVGRENPRLLEGRGEERARGVGEVMVHGEGLVEAAEEPDAVAAHAPLGRPAPAVLLVIGPFVVAFALDLERQNRAVLRRPEVGVEDHQIDRFRRPAAALQDRGEVHRAGVVLAAGQALFFENADHLPLLQEGQVRVVPEIEGKDAHAAGSSRRELTAADRRARAGSCQAAGPGFERSARM